MFPLCDDPLIVKARQQFTLVVRDDSDQLIGGCLFADTFQLRRIQPILGGFLETYRQIVGVQESS